MSNKKTLARWTLAVAACATGGSLAAHHSLGGFDTSAPIWVKGVVVHFERVNPHSVIFMDAQTEDGRVHRWAVDGPSPIQLDRMGLERDFLRAGDVIEVCGFARLTGAAAQRALPQQGDSGLGSPTSLSGQIMNGTLLVMPDGKKRVWSDYGQIQKCASADELDSLLR